MQSQGVLRYSPKLLGDHVSKRWWLVIDCEPEIGKYFRHLHYIGVWRIYALQRPAWDEHITVIRDEKPPDANTALWEKYAGETIEFFFLPKVCWVLPYFWLPVKCPRAIEIRRELGLRPKTISPLHLTIGNVKHYGEFHEDMGAAETTRLRKKYDMRGYIC